LLVVWESRRCCRRGGACESECDLKRVRSISAAEGGSKGVWGFAKFRREQAVELIEKRQGAPLFKTSRDGRDGCDEE
jgi:hypothetical protein